MKSKRPIFLPSDQNFSCTACAKCCVTPWRVKVDSKRAESIKQTKVYSRLEREGFIPLPVEGEQFRIGRKDDGVCQFLTDDQSGCHIHAEAGARAKPSVCQLYPFVLIDTPDGFFVSVTYSCPAVLAGVGEPITEHLAELEKVVSDSAYFGVHTMGPENQVTITERFKCGWADYLSLENHMLQIVGRFDPCDDLLRVACNLVCPNPDINGRVLDEARRVFPTFVANTISVIEELDSQEARVRLATQILDQETHSKLLDFELPPLEQRKPSSLMLADIINRYIKNLIWGKRLVSGPTLATRLLMLAATISILLHYLHGKALKSGERHFNFDDLEWGFDLVEKNLFTHAEDLESVYLEFERTLFSYTEVFQGQ